MFWIRLILCMFYLWFMLAAIIRHDWSQSTFWLLILHISIKRLEEIQKEL